MTIQFKASDFFKKTNEILRQEGNNDCTIKIKDDAIIMLFDNGVQRELDADLNIIIQKINFYPFFSSNPPFSHFH